MFGFFAFACRGRTWCPRLYFRAILCRFGFRFLCFLVAQGCHRLLGISSFASISGFFVRFLAIVREFWAISRF
jgi:hypothetical protein